MPKKKIKSSGKHQPRSHVDDLGKENKEEEKLEINRKGNRANPHHRNTVNKAPVESTSPEWSSNYAELNDEANNVSSHSKDSPNSVPLESKGTLGDDDELDDEILDNDEDSATSKRNGKHSRPAHASTLSNPNTSL